MEKSYTQNKGLVFNDIVVNLLVQPVIEIGFGIRRKDYILQQDSDYGEFLIFQDGYPKFLFSAFNNNGEEKRIASLARKLNIDLGDFIIKLLIDSGYKNVHYLKKSFYYYELKSQAHASSFSLIEIVDYN